MSRFIYVDTFWSGGPFQVETCRTEAHGVREGNGRKQREEGKKKEKKDIVVYLEKTSSFAKFATAGMFPQYQKKKELHAPGVLKNAVPGV